MTIIKIKRGLEASLPTLAAGEFAYLTDTKKLYIGNASGGNTLIGVQNPWGDNTADVRTAVNLAKTSAQTLVVSTNTKITYQGEYTDALNEWDTTNNRFQPKVAGRYLLTVAHSIRTIAAGNAIDLMMVVNTNLGNQSYTATKTVFSSTTASQTVAMTQIIELGPADFVEIFMLSNAANVVEEFPERNYLKIQRLA